ncbi:TPA: hypothetical protein DCW54_00070 [Candidatus Dependentiae bacterium]|nr:hypothetical protein [Candidatus Dependentiae bacterium]
MKYLVSVALIVALLALSGCSWFGGGSSDGCACCRHGSCRPPVHPKDSKQKVALRIVNVLDQELFDDAHIASGPGVESICVQFDDIEEVARSWDKAIPVVVYCSNYFCSASREAASMLGALGFERVYAYEGGMAEWYQLFNETDRDLITGPAQQEYLSIVVEAPEEQEVAGENFAIITALELQNLIKKATISE